jgi:hypothetical protein
MPARGRRPDAAACNCKDDGSALMEAQAMTPGDSRSRSRGTRSGRRGWIAISHCRDFACKPVNRFTARRAKRDFWRDGKRADRRGCDWDEFAS